MRGSDEWKVRSDEQNGPPCPLCRCEHAFTSQEVCYATLVSRNTEQQENCMGLASEAYRAGDMETVRVAQETLAKLKQMMATMRKPNEPRL